MYSIKPGDRQDSSQKRKFTQALTILALDADATAIPYYEWQPALVMKSFKYT